MKFVEKGLDTKYQMCESRTKANRDLVVLMSVPVILYNKELNQCNMDEVLSYEFVACQERQNF